MNRISFMELNFFYTRQELVRAYRRHYNNLINTKKDVGMAVIGFVFAFAVQGLSGFTLLTFSIYSIAVVFLMLPVVAILILPFFIPGAKKFKGQQHWVVKDGVYAINGQTYAINAIEEIRENENQFRIYRDINEFSVLPKRAFSSFNAIADFRKYFSKYLFTFE